MPDYDHRPSQGGTNNGTAIFVIALILCLLFGGGYYYYTVTVKRREMRILEMRMEAEAVRQEALQAQRQAEADLRRAVQAEQEPGQLTAAPDEPNEPVREATENSVEPVNSDPQRDE